MRGFRHRWTFPVILLYLAAAIPAPAGEGDIVSTMRNVNAVAEAHGFRLSPAYDALRPIGEGDLAPPQAFEILRPTGRPVTIGRLFTSCACIQLEAPKRAFEAGERAVLHLRNITPTPLNGQIYAIYVQITYPIRTTLRFDIFVQSQSVILPGPVEEKDEVVADPEDKPEATWADAVEAPDALPDSPIADPPAPDAAVLGLREGEAESHPPSLEETKAEMEAFFREKEGEAEAAAKEGEAAAEISGYLESGVDPLAASGAGFQSFGTEMRLDAPEDRDDFSLTAVRKEAQPISAVTLITIGVRDMARSISFYEQLGWRRGLRSKYDQTAFFQLRGQVLALYPLAELLKEQNMDSAQPSPGGITLAIHVSSEDEVLNLYRSFVESGGVSLREPTRMTSGAVTCYVADPDGNPWEISWVPQFRLDEEGGLWLP
ncbi:MAG: VOC family protein [Planctomycetes bacterium]|nr:VOC family protein [Planctomycetota bacterium]